MPPSRGHRVESVSHRRPAQRYAVTARSHTVIAYRRADLAYRHAVIVCWHTVTAYRRAVIACRYAVIAWLRGVTAYRRSVIACLHTVTAFRRAIVECWYTAIACRYAVTACRHTQEGPDRQLHLIRYLARMPTTAFLPPESRNESRRRTPTGLCSRLRPPESHLHKGEPYVYPRMDRPRPHLRFHRQQDHQQERGGVLPRHHPRYRRRGRRRVAVRPARFQ